MTYSHFDPATQNRVPWNFGAKSRAVRSHGGVTLRIVFVSSSYRLRIGRAKKREL